MNRPAKGFVPANTFFSLRAKPANGPAVTRMLEGCLPLPYGGVGGYPAPLAGLPRFRKCSCHAAYPFGQVLLSDADVPLKVRIQAFNPLIPADLEASSIPVAVIRFALTNRTGKRVAASVCASLANFIGRNEPRADADVNTNRFRRPRRGAPVQGLFMESTGLRADAEQWGTMALCTTSGSAGVTFRRGWPSLAWKGALLEFWDDFGSDGRLEDRLQVEDRAPVGSLAVPVNVPPRATRELTFLISWHFPNRRTWSAPRSKDGHEERVGNFYTTRYRDAWDVAVRTAAGLPALEAGTVEFVNAFCRSDLPLGIKDAALSNVSTLRTETCFRTEDGHFFGFEGCGCEVGCCHGSCTHVWNYEQTTAFLFGALAKDMRTIEFCHATHGNGMMSGRVQLPLDRAKEYGLAYADGQMGCIMRAYREWQLSGDDGFLRRLWPNIRKALEFCWIPKGWDADRDGVMEGCQHNTFDIEYYGPNPMMGTWYLGALRAAEEMARHLGEAAFAGTCRDLYERGRAWIDGNLFNGEYYEQQVRPPMSESRIARGLRNMHGGPDGGPSGPRNMAEPEMQLGQGCQADQLVGQYMAYVCGLDRLLDRRNLRTTLVSIWKHNFRKDLSAHFTHRRTFALNKEAGVIVCTYPYGGRPQVPFPYVNEVWNGFEYALAATMLYEGQTARALRCIQAVRDRHDGRKRNPFDEPECGHHYVRSMAAWATLLAYTGFHYSAVTKTMSFSVDSGRWFWSTGHAWGTVRLRRVSTGVSVDLRVLGGELGLKSFQVGARSVRTFSRQRRLRPKQPVRFMAPEAGRR